MATGAAILAVVRVAIMTAGSRGDAAPYTGLGHRLALAGHEVTLVTHGRFEPLVAGSGVRFPRCRWIRSRNSGRRAAGVCTAAPAGPGSWCAWWIWRGAWWDG